MLNLQVGGGLLPRRILHQGRYLIIIPIVATVIILIIIAVFITIVILVVILSVIIVFIKNSLFGQIVLLESPLVSGPGRNGKPICLACYRSPSSQTKLESVLVLSQQT